jgi:hypothetical protein
MGHARVDFWFGLCFQQELEKGRVGWSWLRDAGRGLQESGDPVIGKSGDRKAETYH